MLWFSDPKLKENITIFCFSYSKLEEKKIIKRKEKWYLNLHIYTARQTSRFETWFLTMKVSLEQLTPYPPFPRFSWNLHQALVNLFAHRIVKGPS